VPAFARKRAGDFAPDAAARPGDQRGARYGLFGVLYSTSFWNGFQTVS
jgi:hypothetical protein